jgi:hypothetical protein
MCGLTPTFAPLAVEQNVTNVKNGTWRTGKYRGFVADYHIRLWFKSRSRCCLPIGISDEFVGGPTIRLSDMNSDRFALTSIKS